MDHSSEKYLQQMEPYFTEQEIMKTNRYGSRKQGSLAAECFTAAAFPSVGHT